MYIILIILEVTFDNYMGKELMKNKVRYLYNKWLNQKSRRNFSYKNKRIKKIIVVRQQNRNKILFPREMRSIPQMY